MRSILIYDLNGTSINLFILDRPWLNAKDFNADMSTVTKILDDQIEKEILSWSKQYDLNSSNKINWLKNYKYKNIYMNNYGTPVLDKNNHLIAYKINDFEYASIETYQNENKRLSNKIEIKDFNIETLSFEGYKITSWIDVKTDFGFVRELNNTKYYYDNNNILFNLEIQYNQPKFPIYKLDTRLNDKIGTIDFETYGNNLGTGYHSVYAAGLAIKDKTELYYVGLNETSEQFINRFFSDILINNNLNGYTIYVHNLGRFDSIFIIKSLVNNSKFSIVPIWKDNSILSLTLKYNQIEIILLDSLQLIPGSLDNILNSFNCKIKKGKFPYRAVNSKTLFYIGNKPAKTLYDNISDQEYLKYLKIIET